jgi:hypothetical protein
MTEKAKEVINDVISKITTTNVTNFIRQKLFYENINIPSSSWSSLNQFIMILANTIDGRGMRQWNKVGRIVNKGAKAFYILVPMIVPAKKIKRKRTKDTQEGENTTEEKETESTSEEDKKMQLGGFRAVPAFRVEDTSGKPLDYEIIEKQFNPSRFPLFEVAKKLNIAVKISFSSAYEGFYNITKNEIYMACDNPQTFLHELSHAIDNILPNKNNDTSYKEIVAELSSAFLASLYDIPLNIEATRDYIREYSGKHNILTKIMEATKRVEEIYTYIENSMKEIPS